MADNSDLMKLISKFMNDYHLFWKTIILNSHLQIKEKKRKKKKNECNYSNILKYNNVTSELFVS